MSAHRIIKPILYTLLICFMLVNSAWANLFIAPTRVVFDDRSRSQTVNLVNTSDKTTTYRLKWLDQKLLDNGEYKELNPSEKFPRASTMLRFSPRQVTLAPGQRQTVRLALRRPTGLKAGDYRSHLLFQSLPDADDIKKEGDTKGLVTQLKLNLGFAIPIIVRQGKYNAQINIDKIDLIYMNTKKGKVFGTRIYLSRKGISSIYGTLKVLWKRKQNDKYKQIGILNNVAVYPENISRELAIGFTDFTPTSGYIKITYTGSQDLKSSVIDHLERKINVREFKKILPSS